MYIPANLDTTQFQDDNLLKNKVLVAVIALAIFFGASPHGKQYCFSAQLSIGGLFCCQLTGPHLADWMSRSAFPPISPYLWFSLLAILFPIMFSFFHATNPYAR